MSAEDQVYTDGGLNPYYIGDCKYCALKAGRIDELEKCGEHRQGIIEIQETHIAELAQQLAELREAALAEVARQRHQYAILRQELPPTTAALAALLQGEKG